MNRKRLFFAYLLSDYASALIAWVLFYLYRKSVVEKLPLPPVMDDNRFVLGILIIPIVWLIGYYAYGLYRNLLRRSRLKEFTQVFIVSFLGVLIIFFTLLLDDNVDTYRDYYYTFGSLFLIHFGLTSMLRLMLTSRLNNKIHKGIIRFNTLLIGSNERAAQLLKEVREARISDGYDFKGFITVHGEDSGLLSPWIPCLGNSTQLDSIIDEHQIEEVILAVETSEHNKINGILTALGDKKVAIKMIPDMYDILTGTVKMSNVLGAVLIEISTEMMPPWQKSMKRVMDIVLSMMALILLFPLMIVISLLVKTGSKGPVFFKQERIGYRGRPFHIIKFRTMFTDAEKNGPQLSSSDDPRITPTGRFLRRSRLDELPQFWNVLVGDMSLVGPRPERKYYIDQIVQKAPHYKRLQQIKPGITSWGQVKYGYAENIDQMLERMRFDLLYLENMSLTLDLKILIYTALIMVQGRGK